MILITGATGFVGSYLQKKKKNYKKFRGDIRSKLNVDKQVKNASIIIHLAALMNGSPKEIFDTNVNGTKNLLECAVAHNVSQFIFGSSSSVYGNYKKIPFSEDDLCSLVREKLNLGPLDAAAVMCAALPV